MGYSGQSITHLIPDDAEAITRDACRDMADAGGKFVTDLARATAPVSAFGRPPGELKASYRQIDVHRGAPGAAGERSYESGVESYDPVAMWVERGTLPHVIKPRIKGGVLKFRTIDGHLVEAKVVHHPGMRGQHIVARAMHEAHLAFDAITTPAAERWAERMRHG